MILELEVVDLVLNYNACNSIEAQIKNIKMLFFKQRVIELEKIFKRVSKRTNYLFSENDGSRCVFAMFKQKNTFEERLYNYRCEPIMNDYLDTLDFENNINLFLYCACKSEVLTIK